MTAHYRFARLLLSALLLASFSLCVSAQSAAAPDSPTILISAHNKDGSPASLTASDLEVKIDGKPAAVSNIQSLGRPALRYCLLFDTSASQRPRIRQHQEEGYAVLKIMQAGRDYGYLVDFSDRPFLDAEGTDPEKLTTAVAKADVRGGTALYDAMVACADRVWKVASPSEMRVMFVLSDGEDNASRFTYPRTLDAVARAGVRVYGIGQENDTDPTRNSANRGVKVLKQVAESMGGKAYFYKAGKEVPAALNEISSELGSVSSLSLTPVQALAANTTHKLEIKCQKKNVKLNAPQEFYVQ